MVALNNLKRLLYKTKIIKFALADFYYFYLNNQLSCIQTIKPACYLIRFHNSYRYPTFLMITGLLKLAKNDLLLTPIMT